MRVISTGTLVGGSVETGTSDAGGELNAVDAETGSGVETGIGVEMGCAGTHAVTPRPPKTRQMPRLRNGLQDHRQGRGAVSKRLLGTIITCILRACTGSPYGPR